MKQIHYLCVTIIIATSSLTLAMDNGEFITPKKYAKQKNHSSNQPITPSIKTPQRDSYSPSPSSSSSSNLKLPTIASSIIQSPVSKLLGISNNDDDTLPTKSGASNVIKK